MEFLDTIADAIYNFDFIIDCNSQYYNDIINKSVLAYVLLALFAVTIGTVAIYYYGVASNAVNATKKNYIVTFLLGLFVLILTILFIVPTIIDDWGYAFGMNNIRLCVINSVYYVILYEIVSIFMKEGSNAKHIHLLNCFK